MKLKHLKWKAHLSTEELVKFAAKHSPIDEDEEMLKQYFAGNTAELKEVEVSWVKRKPDMELRDDPHVYAGMSAETQPPIIVSAAGEIEDGQHRYESAKKRGDKTILAYVVSS